VVIGWRVVWYDEEDNELDRQEFRHESEARRRMARWKEERSGSRVRLFKHRWASRPIPEGASDDTFQFVEEA
jgi:hypothetical protein